MFDLANPTERVHTIIHENIVCGIEAYLHICILILSVFITSKELDGYYVLGTRQHIGDNSINMLWYMKVMSETVKQPKGYYSRKSPLHGLPDHICLSNSLNVLGRMFLFLILPLTLLSFITTILLL